MILEDRGQFSFLDYFFFVIVLVVSLGIGFYYALKSRKTTTTMEDYLLGGRKMSIFPICCSTVATSITGLASVTLTGETYAYGCYLLMLLYTLIIVGIVTSWVTLPIFAELKLTSTFKYFELRFNRSVRRLASALYLLSSLFYLPLMIYAPALTFQRVTGVDIYVTSIFLSVICAVYTAMGGFKAVIWTDVVQLCLMVVSCIIIIIIGTQAAGGIENIFDAASRGGRLLVVNIANPNARNSIWAWLFSAPLVNLYQFGLNQTIIQRLIALPNIKDMKISMWIIIFVFQLFMVLLVFLGIIVYANYESCDPLSAGIIKRVDQILPHFIQDKASLFLGFNGIFIAGVFSAALSTVSSILNAMSGIIYEDFISVSYPRLQNGTPVRIMKTTVLILAVMQIGLIFLIQRMGTLTQIVSQCMALNACVLLTLFILGLVVPRANSTGAQWGAIASIVSVFVLIIGGLGHKMEPMLPLRTDGCENPHFTHHQIANGTSMTLLSIPDEGFWLFRINFVYYCLIGTVVGLSVGYVISILTGGNTVQDQKLLVPFMRKKQHTEEEMTLQKCTLDPNLI